MQAVLEHTEQTLQTEFHIDPYRLVKQLQQGGMASVYLGYHITTGSYVAIKVVDTFTADLKLLYREKEIMQALQHEHIVPCLDAGQDGRYYYMVMPYLRGGTLEDMLIEKPLSLEETSIVLEQLTSALAPSFLNPSIPCLVERVILSALEKDPRHRYQSVEALLHAFQNALEAPNFFGYLSTQLQSTCQKLRNRLSPETETPPCLPARDLAALDMRSPQGQ